MKTKLPYTKEKPQAIVQYHHQYGNCPKYPIKIYNDYIIMSRKGFEELLFSSREYYLLDDIYKTAGKLNEDGSSSYLALYPTRKVGEY